MYIKSRFQLEIDVKTIIIGHVLNNNYTKLLFLFALKLLFECELYSYFQVIYMKRLDFCFNFVDNHGNKLTQKYNLLISMT